MEKATLICPNPWTELYLKYLEFKKLEKAIEKQESIIKAQQKVIQEQEKEIKILEELLAV